MSTHTLSQTLSNNVSTLSPVTVANTVIVTRKPLTDAEKIMNDPSKYRNSLKGKYSFDNIEIINQS